MTGRLLRKLFSAESMGLILAVAALQILTYGISSSVRDMDSKYLFWVCLTAALTSLILSRVGWNVVKTLALMLAIGMIGAWILGARITIPLLNLLHSVLALFPKIVPAIRDQTMIDLHPVVDMWSVIVQSSSVLLSRWQTWLSGLNQNVTVHDALIINMIWMLLLWLVAAWTGWFTERRNALSALLPQMVLLSLMISYSENKIETVWLMMFILLLLMGVWNHKNHTIEWEQHRVDYSDSIQYDNTQAVLLLAISIGAIAFITPSISWRGVRDYLRERNEPVNTADLLGIQEPRNAKPDVYGPKPTLPREHLLKEGFAQSQKVIMTVRTGELPSISESLLTQAVPRYYWRSTVYDEYTGAGWITSTTSSQKYEANTPLIPGVLGGYRSLQLDVQLQQPEGKLFWTGIIYSADTPFQAGWRIRPSSSLFADQTALLQADLFAAATDAPAYHAQVYVPAVTIAALRGASDEYPEEITQPYLALPRTLPERVGQLAEQIVHGIEDPYDKAKAIESYLRSHYPYDLEIPAPPQDQDVVDYFLFDLQRGYCDYYATAMVVLARSSGLPARFVSGYSPGAYDAPGAHYIVREMNAHSWVEIYFPEIGWIEFEPTGSQPEIERPKTELDTASANEPATPAQRILFQFTHGNIKYWLSTIAAITVLMILCYSSFERIIIMRLAPTTAIGILYRRYYRLGRSFAGVRTRAETANEFTDKLILTLGGLHYDVKQVKRMNSVLRDANRFTAIYSSTLFSGHEAGRDDSKAALEIWKRLRRSLINERIRSIILNRNKIFRSSYRLIRNIF